MPITTAESVRTRVAAELDRFIAEQAEALSPIAPELRDITDTLTGFFAGGKFLRPLFVVTGGLAVPAGDLDASTATTTGDAPADAIPADLITLGAAVELIQAAALMHDDVIDNSHTRRGRPAVHEAAATRHRADGFDGDARHFGLASAVIIGDLALSWAEQLASSVLSGPRARAQFDALRTEVMAGQYLDILNQMGGFRSAAAMREASQRVTRWKTVPYTVLRPLLLGAAQRGGDDDLLAALEGTAVPLGAAFQVRDDLLGVFGDQAVIGKSASSDITEGKRTTLLAHALEQGTDEQREVLQRIIGNDEASAEDVEQVREVFTATGARERAERDVAAGAAAAYTALRERVEPLADGTAVRMLSTLIAQATGCEADGSQNARD
ncbi:polyprenyl synthetase family protein [Helcobacillus massiliensis]|uniref:Geranylgeranyl diphosphate synthase type I n=1 Tax=Helcobacillus massiliensis TaxID=521392 RepID=A0A839QTU7_9MICO|nr:geranylgeranyl diphosphate synthase type I [Helcobacillus massiliensis]